MYSLSKFKYFQLSIDHLNFSIKPICICYLNWNKHQQLSRQNKTFWKWRLFISRDKKDGSEASHLQSNLPQLQSCGLCQNIPKYLWYRAFSFSNAQCPQKHPFYSCCRSPLYHVDTSWYYGLCPGNSASHGCRLCIAMLKTEWWSQACIDPWPLKYDRGVYLESSTLWPCHSVLQGKSIHSRYISELQDISEKRDLLCMMPACKLQILGTIHQISKHMTIW